MLGNILLCFLLILLIRIFWSVLFKNRDKILKKTARVLVVMGSGGHTLEMLKLIKNLNQNLYQPRLYVIAEADNFSKYKIEEFEKMSKTISNDNFIILEIPRSRKVNQSYFTSVITTLYSTLKSVPIVFNFKPDLILCNGPGTCVPICGVGFLLNTLFLSKTKIIFIESICRTKTLSLSGKILLYLANVVIVQWLELYKKYPKTLFLGRLV